MSNLKTDLAFLGFAAIMALPAGAWAQGGIEAVTTPSADVTLSFVQPGRIAEVSVKEGDQVTAGQLLVRQDDAVEQARLAQIKAQAEDTNKIQANRASLEQKKVDLEKLERAFERKAATESEVAHARLEVLIAELSLKVAEFEHRQDGRKYEEGKIRVENMSLTSPIAGRAEKLYVEVGEAVNGLEDVVRVVKTDPLWIEVYVPLAVAGKLDCGQSARVAFPAGKGRSVQGSIIFVAAVADAASGTLRVRVQVPNEAGRPAGEHVTVYLSNLTD